MLYSNVTSVCCRGLVHKLFMECGCAVTRTRSAVCVVGIKTYVPGSCLHAEVGWDAGGFPRGARDNEKSQRHS